MGSSFNFGWVGGGWVSYEKIGSLIQVGTCEIYELDGDNNSNAFVIQLGFSVVWNFVCDSSKHEALFWI